MELLLLSLILDDDFKKHLSRVLPQNPSSTQHGSRVARDWEGCELHVNCSCSLPFRTDRIFSQTTETSISIFVWFFKYVLQSVLIIIFLSGTKLRESLLCTCHRECSNFSLKIQIHSMHNTMTISLILFSKLSVAYLLFSLLLYYFHSFQYHGQTTIKTQNIYRGELMENRRKDHQTWNNYILL